MPKYDHLNQAELVALLEQRDRRDATRFGLVWEARETDRDNALNDDFVALDLDPKLSCGEAPWRNLIIEGDNYDALRHLRMAFAGRVKCIYIDPPYNTGNRDFVYNDSFVDREDAWRHSKWCDFMFRRLQLAKRLLAPDGAIFVSIDDNEIFTLGMLMNRVFGESNFVANCIWQKRYSSSNDHKTIAPMHEYVLVYRQSDMWQRQLLPRGEEKDRQYRFEDEQGVFRCSDYTCNKSAEERPNLYYPITNTNTGEQVWPKRTSAWRYSQERHLDNVANNLVYWGKDGKGKVPSFKRYRHTLRLGNGVVPTTWWTHDEVGHNDAGKKELMALLPEARETFSTPKPTSLIDRILQIGTGPDDIVLDFFAGSGTTAHAVHKMNAADGGRRRCILVSNTEATEDQPEKNLCRDVCAKRVRRVISGFNDTPGLGGDFAYLRCRRVPSGRLLRLDHQAVWTALQLIYRDRIAPYDASVRLQYSEDDGQALVYVPRFRRAEAEALRTRLEGMASATVFSWQPDALRQAVPGLHVQHESVAEFLSRKFAVGSRT